MAQRMFEEPTDQNDNNMNIQDGPLAVIKPNKKNKV